MAEGDGGPAFWRELAKFILAEMDPLGREAANFDELQQVVLTLP